MTTLGQREQIKEARKWATREKRKADLPGYGAAYRTKVERELKTRIATIKQAPPSITGVDVARRRVDNIQLSTGEWVDRKEFRKLSTEDQENIKRLGIKGFRDKQEQERKEFEAAHTKLDTGEYVTNEAFDKLPPETQTKLKALGVKGYNAWREERERTFKRDNIQIDSGEWVNRATFNNLAGWQKTLLNLVGVSDYPLIVQGKVIKGTYVKHPIAQIRLLNQIDESSWRAFNDWRTGMVNTLRAGGAPADVIRNFERGVFGGIGGGAAAQALGIELTGVIPGVAGLPQVPIPPPVVSGKGWTAKEWAALNFQSKLKAHDVARAEAVKVSQQEYDKFLKDHELHGGVWWKPTEWKSMPIGDQIIVEDKGYNAYKSITEQRAIKFEQDNVRLADGQYIPKDIFYKDIPFKQRDPLKALGIAGVEAQLQKQFDVLKPYKIVVDGETNYDIVSAARAAVKDNKVHDALTTIFPQSVIDKATEGRIIEPKTRDEQWALWGEEQAAPRKLEDFSKVMAKSEVGALKPIGEAWGKADTKAVEWLRRYVGKDWSKIDPKVAQGLHTFVATMNKGSEDFAKWQEDEALPTVMQFSQLIGENIIPEKPTVAMKNILGWTGEEWTKERKGWREGEGIMKPTGNLFFGALELITTIPATLGSIVTTGVQRQVATITTKDVVKKQEEQRKAYMSSLVLASGLAGFIAGTPHKVKTDPWREVPYLVGMMVLTPKAFKTLAQKAYAKASPWRVSNTALAIEADVSRATVPKGMSPEAARKMVAELEQAWSTVDQKMLGTILRTGKDVVIKNQEGKIVGHATGFQQAVPRVQFHMYPDMYKSYIKDLSTKGHIEITGGEQVGGVYAGQFDSPQAAFTFLARKNPTSPGGLAKLYSIADLRDLPLEVISLLEQGKLGAAKNTLTKLARAGKLEGGPGVYPVWKWYTKYQKGKPVTRLELEMWESPGLKYYPVEPAKFGLSENLGKGRKVGITNTTSPIQYKPTGKEATTIVREGGTPTELKSGQTIPLIWVATKAALAEGRTMPTLAQLYKAELLALVTSARKLLPWNVNLRKFSVKPEEVHVDTIYSSKFTGMKLTKPTSIATAVKDWQISQFRDVPDWLAPKEKVIVDKYGRKLRKRVTTIVLNDKGEVMLVWDKVDKAWSLPGGRHDPKGELGRNWWKGYVDEKGAAYGQVLSETGIPIRDLQKVGVYRGKPTLHSFYGSPVYFGKATKTRFDLKKYHPKQPEVVKAMWWDGKSKITTYPHVPDILKSVEGIDIGNIQIYKGTHPILKQARDTKFADRTLIHRKATDSILEKESFQNDITRADIKAIDDIAIEVQKRAYERVKSGTLPTTSVRIGEFKEVSTPTTVWLGEGKPLVDIPKVMAGRYAKVNITHVGFDKALAAEAIKVVNEVTRITHSGGEVSIRSGDLAWINELAKAFNESNKYSKITRSRLFRTEPPGGEFWTVVATKKGKLGKRAITYEEAFQEEAQRMGDEIGKEYGDLPYYVDLGKARWKLPIYSYVDTDYAKQERPYKLTRAASERLASVARIEARPRAAVRAEARPSVSISRKQLASPKYPKGATPKYPKAPVVPKYPKTPKEPKIPKYPTIPEEPYIVPTPLPTPIIPKTPVTPVIPVIPFGGISWEELTKEQKAASIAWKQGWAYHLIYPDYGPADVLHSKKPFPGVRTHRGPKSAYKSLVRLKGPILPEKILWDMGIMDITFEKGKAGQQPTMRYVPDVKRKTTARRPVGMPQPKVKKSRRMTTSTVGVVR